MSDQHPRALGVRAVIALSALAVTIARLIHAGIAALAVDAIALIGAGLIVYGISLWWVPAAYIAAGLFLLVGAILYSRTNGQ